jgi:branched-chain amino acid transport system permease protein
MRIKHWFVIILVIIFLPILIVNPYQRYVISLGGIFCILTIGLNYVMGLCGQISLAHVAFWGVGAYVSALLVLRLNFPFILALLSAGIICLFLGAILGIPSLKIKGFYLAITTLGFSQIINLILNNWVDVTRGADGLPGIPPPGIGPFIFETPLEKYYVIMICLLFFIWTFIKVKDSRIGRAIQAIRDNELAAEVMGINTHYYKVLSFALSAFIAGIAGSLFAHFVGYVSPDNFLSTDCFKILCMLMIGGIGSTWGPIIGSLLIVILPEWLRFLRDYYIAIYGLAVVIIAIKMPNGIVGLAKQISFKFSWNPNRKKAYEKITKEGRNK